MASTSCAKQGPVVAMKEPPSGCYAYPQPAAAYEEVFASSKLFMKTLESLHATMGTKFMIPIIGGRELDLHRLFVEVTSRGGIEKIMKDRRWKEVTAVFNFPSTATNASFVLRKYYGSLLHHYEQIYFFRARGWTPTADALHQTSISVPAAHGAVLPQLGIHAVPGQPARVNAATEPPTALRPTSSTGSPVIGVIDGKFDSGYLVTVTIGSEKLKGVLYEAPQGFGQQMQQQYSVFSGKNDIVRPPGTQRRRRRKKDEIKRRDPAHPKPNRSGYNFFFAEQHAMLKPLHPGKDREISRMIGERWNKLTEPERAIYQEKAMKDKERYRLEMEGYRERLRTGQVISDAVPLQQRLPAPEEDTAEAKVKSEDTEARDSPRTLEIDSSSSEAGFEDDKETEKDTTNEGSSRPVEAKTAGEAPTVGMKRPAEMDLDTEMSLAVGGSIGCITNDAVMAPCVGSGPEKVNLEEKASDEIVEKGGGEGEKNLLIWGEEHQYVAGDLTYKVE